MSPTMKNLVSVLAQVRDLSQEEFDDFPKGMEEAASPVLMTRAEAASILNVSTRTVMRLMKSGILPTVKTTPTSVRIPRESVLAFAKTGMIGGA